MSVFTPLLKGRGPGWIFGRLVLPPLLIVLFLLPSTTNPPLFVRCPKCAKRRVKHGTRPRQCVACGHRLTTEEAEAAFRDGDLP